MAAQVSSISQALAGNASALKIPQPDGVTNNHAQVARDSTSEAAAIKQDANRTGLPTPPNSISPNLQPEAFTAKLAKELADSPALSQVDSDIDLHDSVDAPANPAKAAPRSLAEDSNFADEVGMITPAYLAKHHLATMILERGPIAIRHLIDYLTRNVPGFADIPPAKARRIVVAALESRHGGGLHGEIEFEKVGWGRWDAKVKGQPSRSHRAMFSQPERPPSPPMSSTSSSVPSRGMRIPGTRKPRTKSRRLSHGSWAAESAFSSRSERSGFVDADVVENEANSMSIDEEEEDAQSSRQMFQTRLPYRIPARRPAHSAFYSDTDEEDWSNIDPAGFDAPSDSTCNPSSRGHDPSKDAHSVPVSFSSSTWSIPPQNRLKSYRPKPQQQLDFTGVDMDSQEKSAIEALLQMGSM